MSVGHLGYNEIFAIIIGIISAGLMGVFIANTFFWNEIRNDAEKIPSATTFSKNRSLSLTIVNGFAIGGAGAIGALIAAWVFYAYFFAAHHDGMFEMHDLHGSHHGDSHVHLSNSRGGRANTDTCYTAALDRCAEMRRPLCS